MNGYKSFDSYELAMRLQKVREEMGKSQQVVADDLGINRNQVKVWECGSREIKAKDLFMLSRYYGVSVDYLLGLTSAATTNTDLRAVCDYTGLSESAINALRNKNDGRNVSCDILSFLIENEDIFELFDRTEEYLKFNPIDKYCVFDDKGNIADCSKPASVAIKEMAINRIADSGADYLFVRTVQTEKLLNRLILSDIESGLGRARKEYQKEHLNFAGEKKEG